jgi:hypothetical protein
VKGNILLRHLVSLHAALKDLDAAVHLKTIREYQTSSQRESGLL